MALEVAPQTATLVGVVVTVAIVSLVLGALVALAFERTRARRVREMHVAERATLLQNARRDLQAFIDAAPVILCYWDCELVNRVANRAWADWFGVDVSSVVGKRMSEILPPSVVAELRPHCEAALAGTTTTFEYTSYGRDSDGPLRTFVVRYVPDRADGVLRGFYVISQEVTEVRRGQSELAALQRDNAALLATLHEHALVSVTDARGRIVDVNEGFCRVSGYRRDELVGQSHRLINSGLHDRAFWTDMWSTISSGRTWRGEVRNRAKDGSFYWVSSLVQPFRDETGRIEKYVSIRTDVTERKAMEERLRHLNERFEVAAGAGGMGIWEYDVATGALAWDARMFDMYGRHPGDAELEYELWRRALHPDDRERVERELIAAMENRTPFDTMFRIVLPDGSSRHIKSAARIAFDESGRASRMTGVNVDITRQKETELELHAKSYLVNSMLASASGFAIISVDVDFRFTMFNTGAERLLGYRSEEVVGISSPSIVHDPDEVAARRAEMVERLKRPVEGKDVFNDPSVLGVAREWTFVRKDGSRVPVSLTVTALHGPDGSPSGYLGIAHDVSIQRESERVFRDAMQKAEQASHAKSQFLANVSHEIRTPMNAVIGLAYLLEGTELDVEQRRFVDRIQTASRGLLGLINDVLDVSKIEAGELRIETVPFELSTLVREQTELMRAEAERKGIAFVVGVGADVPDGLEGDAMRLRQILTNLTSNAIKFTAAGAVHVDVRVMSKAAEHVRLRIAVRDSGIGISADALSRLFTPFAQADTSTTRRFGGSGLGLSIVKQLAVMMGGEIGASSTEGVGSEFWVELPFVPLAGARGSAKRSPPRTSATHLRGVRILVVDDSEINLEVAQRILEREGAVITLARDGRAATDLLAASPEAFDAVLLDVQMPVLDGYGAAREIRARLGLTLPIIALTAGTMSSEHQLALEAGMDDFMSKPFVPRALVDCIRGHLEVRPPALASIPTVPPVAASVWPEIDGIDADEVRMRLLGDVTLFRSLLVHMHADLAETTRWIASAEPLASNELARRLHKLKGAAATLGARSLSSAAAEAETCCRAGPPEQLQRCVSALLERIELLARSIEAALRSAPRDADLDELVGLLDAYDVSVLARMPAFGKSLERLFAPDEVISLRSRIASLQFEAVAASIRERRTRSAA